MIEWPYVGAQQEHTKYSAVKDITAANVGELEIVWRWEPNEMPLEEYGIWPGQFQATPIMVGNFLYLSTLYTRVGGSRRRRAPSCGATIPGPTKVAQGSLPDTGLRAGPALRRQRQRPADRGPRSSGERQLQGFSHRNIQRGREAQQSARGSPQVLGGRSLEPDAARAGGDDAMARLTARAERSAEMGRRRRTWIDLRSRRSQPAPSTGLPSRAPVASRDAGWYSLESLWTRQNGTNENLSCDGIAIHIPKRRAAVLE